MFPYAWRSTPVRVPGRFGYWVVGGQWMSWTLTRAAGHLKDALTNMPTGLCSVTRRRSWMARAAADVSR